MSDGESSLEWVEVLLGRIDFFNGVVTGDNYPLGTDQELATLDSGFERVVVSPDLEMMTCYLLWTELLYEDRFLSFVAVPPDVVALDEHVVTEDRPTVSRLTCACCTVVPL